MTSALARLPFATLAPAAVAAAIVGTALGSSSVAELTRVGRPLRWLALFALFAVAVAWLVARSERLRLTRATLAAAGWFVALMLVSSAWSVQPRLTFERAVSVAVVIAAALLLADAAGGRAAVGERLVYGVVGGAAAVTCAGFVLLLVDRHAAVRPAAYGVPARYQGIGESPNTVALLLALAVPCAVWIALARRRVLGILLLVVFAASLAASASRGGLVGALAGALVVVGLEARRPRRAAVLAGVTLAAFAAAVAVGQLVKPGGGTASRPAAPVAVTGKPRPGYVDANARFPLGDDIGRSLPGSPDIEGRRTLLGSSGRTAVWDYTLGQVLQRPAVGFGFGTEERVFVDRFANFEGGHVENSYIGLMLQLGTVGLASLVAVVGAAAVAGRRVARVRGFGTAAAGALAAGLVIALVQSYLYSAGNIAALTFWLALSLTAVAGAGAAS